MQQLINIPFVLNKVFFSVLVGATQLGQAGPNMEAIATARGAAYVLYNIIERDPPIDVSSEEGEKPADVIGDIEFKDVHFSYPSRPDVKVTLDEPNRFYFAVYLPSCC
jgi:ABC-type multidrug transport system fused ATPase/permease subunit